MLKHLFTPLCVFLLTASLCEASYLQSASPDGNLVLDAEHFTRRAAAYDGYQWEAVSPSGSVGEGAMEIAEGAGNNYPVDYATDSARLDYDIEFTQAGTYYVWVRGFAVDGGADTLHVGLDGVAFSTGEKLRMTTLGSWVWSKSQLGTGRKITLEVTSPGLHTLNLWMRESGMIADRILLTTASDFTPSGDGPEETSRSVGLPPEAPVWTVAEDLIAVEGLPLQFTFSARSPNGWSPDVSGEATGFPGLATFTPLGGGDLRFNWTPPMGSAGHYVLELLATEINQLGQFAARSVNVDIDVLSDADSRLIRQRYYADGKVSIETESAYYSQEAESGHAWQVVANPSASADSLLQAMPDSGSHIVSDIESSSPRVDYIVDFSRTGTYFIWLRGVASSADADGVHVGLNGSVQSTAANLQTFVPYGALAWSNQTESGQPARVIVTRTGPQKVSVWMAKDGFALDKLILTDDVEFLPVGHGPAASLGGILPAFSSVRDGQIAVWDFDEDPAMGVARDAVEGRVLSCSSCPLAVSGLNGMALGFQTSEFFQLSLSSFADIPSGQGFSVEAIVQFNAQCVGSEGVVGRGHGLSNLGWSIGCSAGKAVVRLQGANDESATLLTSLTSIDDERWHHIALVRDEIYGESRLYVDGRLERRAVHVVSGLSDPLAVLTVGKADMGDGDVYLSGFIDAIAIHERALRSDELERNALAITRGLERGMNVCQSPVRVMPLGDSITAGSNSSGSVLYGTYRTELFSMLSLSGYNVDFVGSATDRHPGSLDLNHEGWPGYTTWQIRNNLPGYLSMNTPELILLHIGTNGVTTAIDGFRSLLDRRALLGSRIPAVVARIVDEQVINPDTNTYNALLETEVNGRISAGERLFLTSMTGILAPSTDYYNNLHPNSQGAEKMATVWFDQLVKILPRCRAAAPLLVDMNTLSASAGSAFRFLPEVLGHPIGQFTLESGPAGLLVNGETGEVKWESPVVGAHSFRIRVTNAMGSDAHDYSLTVN